jgi:phage terminase large subunit-like protein
MKRSEAVATLRMLGALSPERRRIALSALPKAAIAALAEEWWWGVHGGQFEPEAANGGGPWRVWAIVAGRGFGKTGPAPNGSGTAPAREARGLASP